MELDRKRILISGATGGLGRAIAEQLTASGAQVVLSSRREKELTELAESLPGKDHEVIVSDLAEPGAGEKLIADAGDLDGLVANAALPASGRFDDFSQEEIGRAMRVNLEAPIHMARELAPKLEQKGEGAMVFIASLSGHAATPRSSLYSATKFGIRGFAFGLREDLYPKGVGVSVVSPGFVRDAGMFAESGASPPAGMGTTTPQKVARAVERAMRRNKSEITVAPWHQVRLAKFAGRHPETAARATRRGGMADKAAAEVAAGQTDKR